MNHSSAIEPLEARIAPAVAIANPLFDITAGLGQTSASVDLAKMVDPTATHRTLVEFTMNYIDTATGLPARIVVELFDDKVPVTVHNFLSYVNGPASADYDGTFFHRIADFGPSSEPGTDIIQAGGFDVSNLSKHIPTTTTVYNEFDPNDSDLQNRRGTIAMAKTGIGPHTGSSEWFFNLTDNSSILGETNNGGFTVFGFVREGLDVIDAIGSAQTINAGGALGSLPVHDYTSGTPKAGQLFQIVDAKVLSSPAASLNGHSFGDVTVTVPGSAVPSDLLSASFDPATNKLNLSFAPGATGQAEVTIPVSRDGETVFETFTVTVKPNLLSELTTHKLPSIYVPGDQGVAKVKISNNSAGLADGDVTVRLYLSELKPDANGDGLPDQPSFLLDAADVLLGEQTFSVNLASGDSTTVSLPFLVKDVVNGVALIHGKQYVVLSEVVPAAGSGIDELFSDDNTNPRLTGHTYQQAFGDLGGRKHAQLTIDTPTGVVTFKLGGKGTGFITRDADGGIDVTLTGTNAGSVLTVKAASGIAHLDDMQLVDLMGFVKLKNATLHGDFTAYSGVKNILFGALGAPGSGVDGSFSLSALPGATQKVNLTFGQVWDYSLTAYMPVGNLKAGSWLDSAGTGSDQIFASQLKALRIAGDLEADVLVAGDTKIAQILVGGTLRDASVKTFGDIGAVKLGSISGSTILAGLNATPNDLADFAAARAIGKFTVSGTFADSIVAAARFNSIILANVDKTAGTEEKGFYADAIKSYVRKGLGGTKLTRLDVAGEFDTGENYAVSVF